MRLLTWSKKSRILNSHKFASNCLSFRLLMSTGSFICGRTELTCENKLRMRKISKGVKLLTEKSRITISTLTRPHYFSCFALPSYLPGPWTGALFLLHYLLLSCRSRPRPSIFHSWEVVTNSQGTRCLCLLFQSVFAVTSAPCLTRLRSRQGIGSRSRPIFSDRNLENLSVVFTTISRLHINCYLACY